MKHNQPEAIFIQLLTYCNANCINCPFDFTYRKVHPNGIMDNKTWNKILSDIIDMEYEGQVGFYLHHEPLLEKTLFNKIKDINTKTKAHVVLSTNGALLTQEKIEKLIEANPRRVHINVNSGNKKQYEDSMKLDYDTSISNAKNFIRQAKDKIQLEINCPVMEGFDVESLKEIFPDVQVNTEYWANSRGGLLPDIYHPEKGSRFKINNYCNQPSQNFNILYDGSTLICCNDWMHESKNDYPNIHESSIQEIYNEMKKIEYYFKKGDYSRYKMCKICSKEMGFVQNDNGNKLNILIANHHLSGNTGSELLTLTLAKQLNKLGHFVTVYSKFINFSNIKDLQNDITFVTKIEDVKNEIFDIAHIHHNISALEVRTVFPELPMVFLSQGVLPFLEQPLSIDLKFSKILALSEEIKDNLMQIEKYKDKIEVIRNLIDVNEFKTEKLPNEQPKKALVISRNIDEEKEKIIKNACNKLKIDLEFVGGRFGEVSREEIKKKIENTDIVFSLGRGALQALIANRAVIVYDYLGGDGMVLPETIDEIRKNNFSGRRYKKLFTEDDLVLEIQKYDFTKILEIGERVRNEYSAESVVDKLIDIYKRILKQNEKEVISEEVKKEINEIKNIINETVIATKGELYSTVIKDERDRYVNDLVQVAEFLIEKNEIDSAKQVLNKALKSEPNNIDLLNDLAVAEIINENYMDAFKLIFKVLALDSQNEIALGNLEYLESLTNKV